MGRALSAEARAALGLASGLDELIERAAQELSFSQPDRARELCDEVIEKLAPGSEWLGPAFYLRGLSRDDGGHIEDFEAAIQALPNHPDPSWEAKARLALARAGVERARAHLGHAVALFARCGLPIQEAHARLEWARLELSADSPDLAVEHANRLLEDLRLVLRPEARRLEVAAQELLGDAARPEQEALAMFRRALEQAERLELSSRGRLEQKIRALEARQGPFR